MIFQHIPTTLFSYNRRQIYLEPSLFYSGFRPAVNIGLSVSRVGGSAQTKAIKKVAGSLKLDLAQYRELESFAQFASDLDEVTKRQLNKGEKLMELLKQPQYAPMAFENQAVVMYAATRGYIDDLETSKIKDFEFEFLNYMNTKNADILNKISSTESIDDETEESLKNAIKEFMKSFKS
ncbi:MAG: hypothetical protein H7A31_01775 [Thermotogae bacterium]|nr:hypothetical protein [Thermotogota bacterium]